MKPSNFPSRVLRRRLGALSRLPKNHFLAGTYHHQKREESLSIEASALHRLTSITSMSARATRTKKDRTNRAKLRAA